MIGRRQSFPTSLSSTCPSRPAWETWRSRRSRLGIAVGGCRSGRRRRLSAFLIHGEHRVYFAGDTDVFPEMAELARDLDLAILPVGGWGPTLRGGHMDPSRAAEALTLLRPRTAVAVHWGTLWPVGMGRVRRDRFEAPGRRFIEEASRVAPFVQVRLLDPGDQFDIPPREALAPVRT